MARAIAVIRVSAAAHLPRSFVSIGHFFVAYWHDLTRHAIHHYRPEMHYMRGPGPAWRAKHGEPPAP